MAQRLIVASAVAAFSLLLTSCEQPPAVTLNMSDNGLSANDAFFDIFGLERGEMLPEPMANHRPSADGAVNKGNRGHHRMYRRRPLGMG